MTHGAYSSSFSFVTPMARFYFDLRDGDAFVADDEGVELLDIANAQIEAAETLSDMTRDLMTREPDAAGHPMSIEVRDSKGPRFLLAFAFARSRIDG